MHMEAAAAGGTPPRRATVDDVFLDFKGRRTAIVKALTTGTVPFLSFLILVTLFFLAVTFFLPQILKTSFANAIQVFFFLCLSTFYFSLSFLIAASARFFPLVFIQISIFFTLSCFRAVLSTCIHSDQYFLYTFVFPRGSFNLYSFRSVFFLHFRVSDMVWFFPLVFIQISIFFTLSCF